MKNYETPILVITALNSADIITTSIGDTPDVDWEW